MALLGGREIHPVNVRVGGFYRAPTPPRAARAGRAARSARARSRSRRCAGSPASTSPTASATTSSSRSAIRASTRSTTGAIVSTTGLDIAPREYDEHFEEQHVDALERAALPPARTRHLPGRAAGALQPELRRCSRRSRARRRREAGLGATCRNPFRSIVVRAVELVYACDEALRLIDAYEAPDAPAVEVDAARRRRLRLHRGAARHALPPLPARRATARSSTRRSCRRPRRTSRASRTTCAAFVGGWLRPARRRRCACAASRRSATTTRASPARPTSSSWTW